MPADATSADNLAWRTAATGHTAEPPAPLSSAAAVCSAWEDLAPFLGRSRSEDKLIILVTLIIQHLLSYCYTQGTGHSAGATGEIKRLTCG